MRGGMDAADTAHGSDVASCGARRRAPRTARGCDLIEDHRCARGVNEGNTRIEERQRLLRGVSRVRGGLRARGRGTASGVRS
jgi:hypothetical protein